MSKLDPKHYLDYLDKEMTIMGILSACCVAVVAALLNGIFTAAKGLWRSVARCGFWYGLVGSVFFLLAAFSFYVQRSHLAWLYGQISLCSSQGDSYRIFDDPFGKDDKREPPDL